MDRTSEEYYRNLTFCVEEPDHPKPFSPVALAERLRAIREGRLRVVSREEIAAKKAAAQADEDEVDGELMREENKARNVARHKGFEERQERRGALTARDGDGKVGTSRKKKSARKKAASRD